MNVLYLALSTARAREVRYATDFLVARGVAVDLLVDPDDDWSSHRIDRRVAFRPYREPEQGSGAPAPRLFRYARGAARRVPLAPVRSRALRVVDAADRRARRAVSSRHARLDRAALATVIASSVPEEEWPDLVVIGGAASLPLAHRLADAFPGLELTFELDWAHPAFADLPVLDTSVDPQPLYS